MRLKTFKTHVFSHQNFHLTCNLNSVLWFASIILGDVPMVLRSAYDVREARAQTERLSIGCQVISRYVRVPRPYIIGIE